MSLVLAATGLAPRLAAQPAAEQGANATTVLPAEVIDALDAIERSPADRYALTDVQRLLHAVWWDLTYSAAEEELARKLNSWTRPATFTGEDGRTVTLTKLPADDAAAQQRFLLVNHYTWKDSSYFVQAFRNTKDAGLFIGACRVHENAAEIMETTLIAMVNEARFASKQSGNEPLLRLFRALETSWRDANPNIRGEFADAVRRVVAKFDRLPPEITRAPWLQPPSP